MKHRSLALLITAGLLVAGCNTQPTILENPDPNLRKSVADLRSDSESRFPYRFAAPHVAEQKVRAQVDYGYDRLDICNFTGQDWQNVEVWVNRQYVCFVPVMQDRQLKRIDLAMLYDIYGKNFPLNSTRELIRQVELYKDGQFHEIKCATYDW